MNEAQHRSHTWRSGKPDVLRRRNSLTYRRPCTHHGCKAAYVLRENSRGISLGIEECGRQLEPSAKNVSWERGLALLEASIGGTVLL